MSINEEINSFIVLLIGDPDKPLDRTFAELQRFREVLTEVWIEKEDKFISTLQIGQVYETVNMANTDIGVIQRIVGRTVYLTNGEGLVYHSTAERMKSRIL